MPQELKLEGLDFKNGKFIENSENKYNYDVVENGKYITANAAFHMIYDQHWEGEIKKEYENSTDEEFKKAILSQTSNITFDKSVLLMLLSQDKCRGIRCYICKNQNNERSLVLIGIDKNENDLIEDGAIINQNSINKLMSGNQPYPNSPEKTLIAEVGGHGTYKAYSEAAKNAQDPSLAPHSFAVKIGNIINSLFNL